MEKFSIIWRIKITHSYYYGGECQYFELKPSPQTTILLQKRGCLFRKMGTANWAMIGDEDTRFDPEDVFVFELLCGDQKFYYVTEKATIGKGCPQIEMTGTEELEYIFSVDDCKIVKASPGVITQITLKLKSEQIQEERYNKLTFGAPENHLEYIFLFRNGRMNQNLLVEDVERKMFFLPGEKIQYMGCPGICFQSAEKYPLSESPNLKLQLLELLGTNRRVITRRLPYPEIGMFIDAPPGILRTVSYV